MSTNNSPAIIFHPFPEEYKCLGTSKYYYFKDSLYDHFNLGLVISCRGGLRPTVFEYERISIYMGYVSYFLVGSYYQGHTYNFLYDNLASVGAHCDFTKTRIASSLDAGKQWVNSYNGRSTFKLRVEVDGDDMYVCASGKLYGGFVTVPTHYKSKKYYVKYGSASFDVRLMRFRRVDLFCNDFKFQEIKGLLGG